MRMLTLLFVPTLLVSACVSPPPAPPAMAATPRPAPPPPPAPVAPAPAPTPSPVANRGDWRDWPRTPGDWVYRQDARGSIALFGQPGADAELTLRCDRAAAVIYVSRRGPATSDSAMTVRTTSIVRTLAMRPTGGNPSYLAVTVLVRDPLLDAMGFSRGHFVIEQAGLPVLVVPAWAEILRVTEDCRS